MKNCLLLLLLVFAGTAFGQKKNEMQAQLDTLKKSNTNLTSANAKLTSDNKRLTLQSDSLSKELDQYYGLYKVIKEKVVKTDFDPAKMANIIDSLRAGRDSLKLSSASALLLVDSMKVMRRQIDSLQRETQNLMYTVNILKSGSGTNPNAVTDFVGRWNVILRKVKITGTPPKAAIVDISAEPAPANASTFETNPIARINFVDAEIAELTLANNDVAKCFYEIVGFSTTKPYYIDFKGTKADIRVYFMNTTTGPRMSFQVPEHEGAFYFGQLVK
jgi:hypothetical protein